MKKGIIYLAVITVSFLGLINGCSTAERRTEHVYTSDSDRTLAGDVTYYPSNRVEKERVTTQTTTENRGALDVIGEVLAFPFQLIANIFRAIF